MRIFGAGLWAFGQFVDRYASDGYGPSVDTLEAIERAGAVKELSVLDINYPFPGEGISIERVKKGLEAQGLRAVAITPAIFTGRFARGAFTNPDPRLRKEALEIVSAAVEVAYELGADYVKLWPGQDGFDYPFQVDYESLWSLQIEGVREVATAHPDVQFAIEYKPKEPRTHMLFSTAARTLLAIEDMRVDNVGVVMDLGHSLYAKETPADALRLVAQRGKLVGIELNDNFREWDDDMTVGSVHLVESLEFLKAVGDIGWDRPILLDQFPFREDTVEAARLSLQVVRRLLELIEGIDDRSLKQAQESQDALAAQRLVQEILLGKGDLS